MNNCSGIDPRELISFNHFWRLVWIGPTLASVLGISSNALFLFLAVSAWRSGKIAKKRYIFLINLAIGDVIQFIGLSAFGLLTPPNPYCTGVSNSKGVIFVFTIFGVGLAVQIYLALTFIRLLAVRHPFLYSISVTVKRCFQVVALIWVLSLSSGGLGYLLKYKQFIAPVAGALGILFLIIYATTLILYGLTWTSLHGAGKNISDSQQDREKRKKVVKFGVHQVLFFASFSAFACFLVYFVSWYSSYEALLLSSDPDKNPQLREHYRKLSIVLGVGLVVWFARGIVDPVIHISWDENLKARFGRKSSGTVRYRNGAANAGFNYTE